MRASSDLSSLFEGTPTQKTKDAAEGATSAADGAAAEEVELVSEAGVSYENLQALLAAGEWEKADDETRLKLIELAGPAATSRGWVYFTEVKTIPEADLRTLDALWRSYSDGRYGYSVQRAAWLRSKKVWTRTFQAIDWVQGENNAYRKFPAEFLWEPKAAKGHLPLTNCLRGTQLFQAILEHPAFAKTKAKAK